MKINISLVILRILTWVILKYLAKAEEGKDELQKPHNLSIGNQKFKELEWNFLVSISYGESHKCGGTLVRSNWVLTSASCILPWSPNTFAIQSYDFVARIGAFDLKSQKLKKYDIKLFIVHPKYDTRGMINDIALLMLESNVNVTDAVKLIKLSNNSDIPGNTTLYKTAGWGRNYPGVEIKLRELNLTIIADSDCAKKYKKRWKNGFPITQFCILLKTSDLEKIDAGGPVIYDGKQFGIMSWAKNIDFRHMEQSSYTYIYSTHVYRYLDWINHVCDNLNATNLKRFGYPAKHKWPYLVSIKHLDEHQCAGVIVGTNWIFTADTCIPFNFQVEQWKVITGVTDLLTTGTTYEIEKKINLYEGDVSTPDDGYRNKDVALLKLKKEIVFSKNVKIVNFPTRPVRYKTPKCYVAGWKTQSAKRKKTKRSLYLQNKTMEHILKEKAVDIISLKRCAKQNYQNYYNSMPIQLDDTFLCTKMHNQIFDICLGDIGAPLVCDNILIGIAAWGKGCVLPVRYDLWTRFDRYISWILMIMEGRKVANPNFGKEVERITKWNFMASLRAGGKHYCTGIYLFGQKILTSASCMEKNMLNANNIEIVVGTLDALKPPLSNIITITVGKNLIIPHVGYIRNPYHFNKKHDLALLLSSQRLYGPVVTLKQKPAEIGTICQAASWRIELFRHQTINYLREVEVKIINITFCREYYGRTEMSVNFNNFVCTVPLRGQNDLCMVEGGVPLICDGELQGFGAFKYGCREIVTDAPTMWTRIDDTTYQLYGRWLRLDKNELLRFLSRRSKKKTIKQSRNKVKEGRLIEKTNIRKELSKKCDNRERHLYNYNNIGNKLLNNNIDMHLIIDPSTQKSTGVVIGKIILQNKKTRRIPEQMKMYSALSEAYIKTMYFYNLFVSVIVYLILRQ